MEGEDREQDSVPGKALRVLEKYPLCDRCLGRLFAGLGYGWSNRDRGEALKKTIVMLLHERIRLGIPGSMERFREIAPNIGEHAGPLYEKLYGERLEPRACYICGGLLDRVIEESSVKGKSLLKAYDVTRYVVGVKVDRLMEERERGLREEFQLPFGESIRAEIRREVGKRIMDEEMKPDFAEPEATLLVHYPSGSLDLQVNSLLLRVRYWKKARFISQAYWPSPEGPRYFSVEQAAWGLLKLTGAERLVLHASGREDVDARMLGSGRPAVIELKVPRRRRFTLAELEEWVNKEARGLVEFKVYGYADRRMIRYYKEEHSRTRKIYKALIAVEREVNGEDLRGLEEFFRNRVVLQRTPRRVLHRRPDVLRKRTVYSVKCTSIARGVIECLVSSEGGLYVKELVSGDEGRTKPSFSEYLGARSECVELDVLYVEH